MQWEVLALCNLGQVSAAEWSYPGGIPLFQINGCMQDICDQDHLCLTHVLQDGSDVCCSLIILDP